MEKTSKKFKLRFSYFLIAGILGIILQAISFFSWSINDLSGSQISNSGSMDYFNRFMRPSYFLLFSAIFIIVMCVGIFFASRKDQYIPKFSSIVLCAAQLLMIIALIIFLAKTKIGRKDMYANDATGKAIRKVLDAVVLIKNISLYISTIAMCAISYSFIGINKKRKVSHISSWLMLVGNALLFVTFTAVLFAGIKTPAIEFISKFYETDKSLAVPFTSNISSMNGFTSSTMVKMLMLIQEINNPAKVGNYTSIQVGAVFTFIACISYIASMTCNFFGLCGITIESFDVIRDDDPMAL